MDKVDRINLIFHNEVYKKYLEKNRNCEKDRYFCLHDLQHFLDVARIAYIISLERDINIKKDIIYAAALLHDIGRWQQYEHDIPHDEASSQLAVEILQTSDFTDGEIDLITGAIREHREKDKNSELGFLLYAGDKLSRKCYDCDAFKQCNWSEDKKNLDIIY
ncbi:HD domain-containing protein [Clostridium pasteurianum]|uniref:Putative domain HDIG-containing protein n=1 Tax=Clostridium pasteurianum BC1 TaxID=86416 RepID=R4K0P8_CLOPA|nr:HD domain-containing protein [Clostridium pasteurianum]AGK95351.1 putative domain HDIG-containing protein [Clostridium pasteurianum BC1]